MNVVDLRTTHLVVGGAALARANDGRVVFVSGALPGELVRVAVRTSKKDFAAGDVVEVVEASADRVVPACAAWHRGCGGCDWQHIAPAAQLALKTAIVAEALTRTARLIAPHVFAGAAVQPWGYRTTIRVAGGADGAVGFRSRHSHDIVAIDECPVADPAVNAMLRATSLARGQERVLRASVDGREHSTDATGLVHETVAGQRLRVSAESFFQSSPAAAALLVDAVARAAHDVVIDSAVVVDAYGGVGLFGATVARDARHLVLVESSPSSCADARVNLPVGATVVERRVEEWAPVRADLVIADPARAGLDKAAAAVLAATGAPIIVLVSCDTGSLARDCRLLEAHGYRHDGTEVLDVFPNTAHIESVTRFVRTKAQVASV